MHMENNSYVLKQEQPSTTASCSSSEPLLQVLQTTNMDGWMWVLPGVTCGRGNNFIGKATFR